MGKYYKYKNLEENRFQEFDKSDILSGPLHIAIDITNKCNAKCLHCFNRSGNGLLRNEISDREMLEIFNSNSSDKTIFYMLLWRRTNDEI